MPKYIYAIKSHTHKLDFIVTGLLTTSSTKPKVVYSGKFIVGLSYSVFAENKDAVFFNFYHHLN